MLPSDERIARALLETRTIALVGASIKPERESHRVGNYLASVGYRVIPINTGHVGKTLFGQTVVGHLSDIQEDVQLVDIFRKPVDVLPVVQEALASLSGLRVIWMQLGIQNPEACASAEARALTVVEDRCTAIEHRRFFAGVKSA